MLTWLLRKLVGGPSEQVKKSNKWRFYVGLILLFIGLFFLLRFGIGLGTWFFLGIGLGNLAIWVLVKWSLYKLDQTRLKDKNAESHNT